MIHTSTYTNNKSLETTISTYINDRLFISLNERSTREVNIFLRPGTVKSSFFTRKAVDKTFEIGDIQHLEKPTEEKEYLLETFIRQDNLTLTVTRSEYSFFVWLAMLGGISKIIKTYCAFITDAVSRKMFVNSILSNLFFVKERKDHEEEGVRREAMSREDLKKLHEEVKKSGRTMDSVATRLDDIVGGDAGKKLRLVT